MRLLPSIQEHQLKGFFDHLHGVPSVLGPILGRITATVTCNDEAQPVVQLSAYRSRAQHAANENKIAALVFIRFTADPETCHEAAAITGRADDRSGALLECRAKRHGFRLFGMFRIVVIPGSTRSVVLEITRTD